MTTGTAASRQQVAGADLTENLSHHWHWQHQRRVPSFIGAGNSTCDSSTAAWQPDLTWSAYVVHLHSCSGPGGQATLYKCHLRRTDTRSLNQEGPRVPSCCQKRRRLRLLLVEFCLSLVPKPFI